MQKLHNFEKKKHFLPKTIFFFPPTYFPYKFLPLPRTSTIFQKCLMHEGTFNRKMTAWVPDQIDPAPSEGALYRLAAMQPVLVFKVQELQKDIWKCVRQKQHRIVAGLQALPQGCSNPFQGSVRSASGHKSSQVYQPRRPFAPQFARATTSRTLVADPAPPRCRTFCFH